MSVPVTMLVNAQSISPDSIVLVNLSNNEQGEKRITVNENLTLKALGLTSFEQAKAPDSAKLSKDMAAISTSSYYTPTQKQAEITKLVNAFNAAQAEYQASGGSPVQDRIAMAVCDWLVANRGFSRKDVTGKAVVNPSDLQVTTVNTGTGLLFSVTGTSVWG